MQVAWKKTQDIKLQFYLLPIRDWNSEVPPNSWMILSLQFYLLPIRDWNVNEDDYFDEGAGAIAILLTPY